MTRLGPNAERRSARTSRFRVACAVLVAALAGGLVRADYLKDYWDGREAFRNRKYREAVVFFDRAIRLQPTSGERVRWTGTHFESYLPHFHLGRALYELGLFEQAARVWAESLRQGRIREKANQREYRELQRKLAAIRDERLPEALEQIGRDVEQTARQLERLQGRGIGGLVRDPPALEEAANLLESARRDLSQAESQGELGPLGQAGQAVDEARARMLAAIDAIKRYEEERGREAEARRQALARQSFLEAAARVEAGACDPEATRELDEVLRGGGLPADLRKESAPLVVLARAHEQCGDPLGALQYLQLALQEGQGDAEQIRERQRRLSARRRSAALGAVLGALSTTGASGADCRVATIATLASLRGGDDPRVEAALARAYLACTLPDEAAAALGRARAATDELDDELRELQARIDATRLAASPEAVREARQTVEQEFRRRAAERARSDYLVARVAARRGGCDRDAVARMESLLPAVLPNDASFDPYLDLARAFRDCGDRSRAADYLQRVRRRPGQVAEEVERLTEWLARTPPLDMYAESHALVVGIARYDDPAWGALPEVLEDTREVSALLRRHGFVVRTLVDPASSELARELERFFGRKRPRNSRLVFYYGGHGHTEVNDYLRLGYIVPADTPYPEHDSEGVYLRHLVSMDGFEGFATATGANHAMFLFDSCFSGTVFDATATRFRMNQRAASRPAERLGRPVRLFVTAGDETQQVPAASRFRAAVVRGLEGFADEDADGLILGTEVGDFVVRHGATPRNTPQWGVLELAGYDAGDLGFGILEYDASRFGSADGTLERDEELALWLLVAESESVPDLRRYLELYPDGTFAPLAAAKIERLDRRP